MTLFKVEELEAGPLLDQAVLRALGATHAQECPEGVPDNVRARWPADGCLVLVDGSNMAFYGQPPPFSTDWGVAGPLIERERITVQASQAGDWRSFKGDGTTNPGTERSSTEPLVQARADTPIVAAMRVLVLHKVGPTIEVRERSWNVGTPTVTQGPPR